ncbi:BLUF domain-containing protein [Sphingomonas sp. BAUL-RG-20F-R05-02]|uniref:BLUF domain-containing protein n=1 Tax=Sphingomonas sp. BAUL-RG-20F-R05-02 TaxID=2914830 RepID=UPI0024123E99|nr:BLUF domain-containing protein [Sphingomonas sp. BAUL-RG-20F-R05-02]
MRRLIYISLVTASLCDDHMETLVSTSSLRNHESGITGMLWFNGIHFAQVLEGDAEAVDAVMRRIVKDQRHTNIQIITDVTDDRRIFGTWGMTLANDGPERLAMSMLLLGSARGMAAPDGDRISDIVISSLD